MAVITKKAAKPGLSRQDVAELYTDVRRAMAQVKSGAAPQRKATGAASSDAEAAKIIALEIKKAMARDSSPKPGGPQQNSVSQQSSYKSSDHVGYNVGDNINSSRFSDIAPPGPSQRAGIVALGLVCVLGILKLTLSGVDALGVLDVKTAQASIISSEQNQGVFGGGYSREEVRLLQSLDGRRVELEEQTKKVEGREREFEMRDREFTVRTAQLKTLADRLKTDRERTEKKRDVQVEQLANVYSSMGAQEAAQLLEQLDVTISLPLIERMPEKKIGQILGLMSRERALVLTKMLSASR